MKKSLCALVSVVAALGSLGSQALVPAGGAQVVVTPAEVPGSTPPASTTMRSASPFDENLANQLAALLANDPTMKGAALRVSARDGNVTVSGTAVDATQAARARQVVDAVVGVGHASYLIAAQQP